MKKNFSLLIAIIAFAYMLSSCDNNSHTKQAEQHGKSAKQPDTTVHYPQEKHLANIRQLTDGGDNAEAYFSFDNSMIVFQAKVPEWGSKCDQIYYFNFADGDMKTQMPKLLSEGLGRTTCSYFMPGDTTVLYADQNRGPYLGNTYLFLFSMDSLYACRHQAAQCISFLMVENDAAENQFSS